MKDLTPSETETLKMFDEKFLYWVVLGSTLNDGSELRWNVGEGKLPNIEAIKDFLLTQLRLARSEGFTAGRVAEAKTCAGCSKARDDSDAT